MKKFLLFVFLFSVSFCAVKAQENVIYKGKLKIKEKAYILVEEKLKIIVDDEIDFPFIRRLKKDNEPVSITLTLNDKRIEFSNPFEKDRIFCDYLAYAYAFGIGKGLVKMFPAHFSYTLVASLNCMTANRTLMFNVFQSKIYHNKRSHFSSGSSLIRTIMKMRRK